MLIEEMFLLQLYFRKDETSSFGKHSAYHPEIDSSTSKKTTTICGQEPREQNSPCSQNGTLSLSPSPFIHNSTSQLWLSVNSFIQNRSDCALLQVCYAAL